MKTQTILAIESSCDETASAIVQKDANSEAVKIISETTATSLTKHRATKGIVPEVAAREQVKFILPVIQETLKKANIRPEQLTAIAVTTQPGLIGSLLVGVEVARTLASVWNSPIIPVNHISAHPYANFVVQNESSPSIPAFPLLSWVISGGHTQLTYYESHEVMKVLGKTVDDAAGECLDKCARLLGGDYPGGPFIEELALQAQDLLAQELTHFPLPRPLMHEQTYDVSFSGLKTAFSRMIFDVELSDEKKSALAKELQCSIADVLVKKTERALVEYPETKSLLISGGVTANKFLQSRFKEVAKKHALKFFAPPLNLSTDNAVMIGAYALFHPELETSWEKVTAKPY